MTISRLSLAVGTAVALTATVWLGAVELRAAQAKNASEGIYTKAQADRGMGLYNQSCASCHELSKFKGTEFTKAWTGKPLTELHAALLGMPMDAPGSMKPQEYADIVAYFLSINDYPTGAAELAGDEATIKSVTLDPKKP